MAIALFENDQKYFHFSDHLLDTVMKLDAANISQLSFLSSYKSYQKFDKSATILGSASGNLLTWTQVCRTKHLLFTSITVTKAFLLTFLSLFFIENDESWL